jgi:ferric-dicitrate binding protein FerR (iron transport regulator)
MNIDRSRRADALAVMRESQVPLEDAADAEARAERLKPRIATSIRLVPELRRSRTRRAAAFGTMAAVAAAAVFAFIAWRHVENHPMIDPARVAAGAPTTAPLVAQTSLPENVISEGEISDLTGDVEVHRAEQADAPGTATLSLRSADEVATRATGRTRITMSNGARVRLSGNTRVRLQDGGSEAGRDRSGIVLASGRVDVQVPKLNGGSFVVTTPQAQVVVHGTIFSVEVFEPDAKPGETCVAVTEGSVSVHSNGTEARLGPSGHWSSLASSARCEGRAAARRNTDHPAARPPANALAVQNSLFQAAITARHRGEDREAIRLFDELLQKYPDSPLGPEAIDQRKRAMDHLRETSVPPE